MGNTETKSAERKKFEINVTEPAPFPGVAQTAYLSSQEFCLMVSELFKAVFADYEGCVFELAQNGEPTIALFFNHGEYTGEDVVVACERAGANINSGNSVITKSRTRDYQMREGDRYYLTEDGKDAVTKLLIPRKFNNGNPNWKEIVAEYSERSPMGFYTTQNTPQYTKVSFIDPKRLCSLIFGSEIDGDTVDYGMFVAAPLGLPQYQQMSNKNYMLNIVRASAKEVGKIYEKLGFGTMGTAIVR